jgi:DNA-binding PadR family transcriptional regulator
MSRKSQNPLALAVLSCLFERPMHPYEIATTLRERHKDESIKLNYGSLYAVVEGLQRRGHIVAAETMRQGNRPERTIYRLTDAGRVELIDWLSGLLSEPVKEFTQFEAGLSLLPVLSPEDAVRLLEERRERLEVETAQAASLRGLIEPKIPRLFYVEAEYRWKLKEAELDFVRALIADIRANRLEGLDFWRGFHKEGGADAAGAPTKPGEGEG